MAFAVLLAGCSGANSATTTVTYIAVTGGAISFGLDQGPTGCNPNTPSGDSAATQEVLSAVLPSPFVVGPTGAVEANPNLIQQSELVSTKPETIIYTLNPQAVWSDGMPITANDFIYAWQQQRAASPTSPSTVASIAGYRDIASVKGSNQGRTVTVVFRTVFADWQMLFANLMPAHIMQTVGWDPHCASVTPAIDLSGGPYVITSVSPEAIGLRANPKWWGVPPNSRSITVHIASSPEQLAQWTQSGYVQVAMPADLTPAYLSQMTSLPGEQSSVDLSDTFLQLEMASGPTTPLPAAVRQAIALSVDRQALVDQQVMWALPSAEVATSHIQAQGQPGYTPLPASDTPPTVPQSTTTSTTTIDQGGAVNFPTTTSPDQAAQLMVSAGYVRTIGNLWRDLLGTPLTLRIAVDDGDAWAAATAPQLEAQLEAAGYTVSLLSEPDATAAGTTLSTDDADLALLPMSGSPFYSQSIAWYSTLLGLPGQNGSQDWTNYNDTTFNQMVTMASQQLNPTTAATDYTAADAELWTDMVGLPLFSEPKALVWSRSVGGVVPSPMGNSLLWTAQDWAIKVPESTDNTTPTIPGQ
ncbi:MAG: ABC transporter substrate-binding protein [Acidimicrobiales bacterium]